MKKEKITLRLRRSRIVPFVHMLAWYHNNVVMWDCYDSFDDNDIVIFDFFVNENDVSFIRHFVSAWEAS